MFEAHRYRGRHRAPSTTARTAARVAVGAGVAVLPLGLASPAAADTSVWDRVAQCESSGRWDLNVGTYDGGLQFLPATWRGFGGTEFAPTADRASKAEQITVARAVLAEQGPGAWPVCSRKAGLTRANGAAAPAPDPTVREVPNRDAPAVAAGVRVRVEVGDTLAEIATARGVAGGWRALHEANRGLIPDPNLIMPGWEILLP